MRCAIFSSVGINPTPIRDQYLISVLSPTLILGQHLRFVLLPKAIPNDMVENTRYLGESDILTIISSTLGRYHIHIAAMHIKKRTSNNKDDKNKLG